MYVCDWVCVCVSGSVRAYERIIIINIISINRKQAVNLCAHLAKLLLGHQQTFDLCPLPAIGIPLPTGQARILRIRRIRRTVSSIFDNRRTRMRSISQRGQFPQ